MELSPQMQQRKITTGKRRSDFQRQISSLSLGVDGNPDDGFAESKSQDQNSGISPQGISKGCLCPATSTRARRQHRKRKNKHKVDSSDSEVNSSDSEVIPSRGSRRLRKSRRGLNMSNTIGGMLNSTIFVRHLEHLWSGFPEEKLKSFTYFEPLWFSWYAEECYREMVLRQIKEKDVFSKKYVLVPIVMWSHWSLLIFCHLGESLLQKTRTPCMLLLDSLHATGPTRLEPLIRRIVFDIHKIEERQASKELLKKIPLLVPKVPQQRNGEECGFYVLHYINLFLESAPENFSLSEGYPYFMKKDWFTSDGVESFYKTLASFPVDSNDHNDHISMDSSYCDDELLVILDVK
ncbi:Cysteine proteinases superfamily protein [Abeliophyllum distichum]|uniref:Cysteine proteinases superfamily protein n=1 Tax=Abeliophyllum distichum TaxID=126358 RepID=A0ABD1TE00_9LAMI